MGAATAVAYRARAVIADDAAIENTLASMEQNVVGQIYRQVRRIRLGLKIGDLRRPPADVNAREHHAAAAHKQASLIVRYVDDDRRKNVRMEHQVIVTCAGLVELSP